MVLLLRSVIGIVLNMNIRSTQTKEAIRDAFGGPFYPINKSDIISGITTREWFAGMIAQGFMSSIPSKHITALLDIDEDSEDRMDDEDARREMERIADRLAELSFIAADKLLEKRGD